MSTIGRTTHGKEFQYHNNITSPQLRKDIFTTGSKQHARKREQTIWTDSGVLGFHLLPMFHILLHIYQEKEPEKVKYRYGDTLN